MKRILSCILSAVLLLLTFPVFAENIASSEYNRIDNSIYNLIEAKPFEGDKPMTKAEASYYLAQIVKGTGNINNVYFEDVKSDHPYFSYVNYAFENDLFERKNNLFYPDNQIKVKDFLEAALKLAGYTEYVEVRGIKYSILMSELDVPKQIISILEKAITVENFEDVLYAAINLPTCQFTGVKVGKTSTVVDYVISEDETLIEMYRDVEKVEGRIVGDRNISLYDQNGTESERILFQDENGDILNLNYGSSLIISNVIGLELEAFTNKDIDTLIYYHVMRDKSERVIINGDDVINVKTDMSQLTYYNEKGRTKTLKFSDETVFIYNGKNCYGIIPEYFTSKSSRTIAIDIEDDGTYDVVFVDQYVNIIVSAVNEKNLSLTDLCDSRTYRFDEYDSVTVIKNNKVVPFSEIHNDNVVSMAISLDGESVTLYISEKIIYSYLKTKGMDDITIDGNDYRYSCDADIANIQLGSECVFGITYYGYVGCVKKLANTELLYGYLIWISYSDKGFDENTYIKLLTPDNKYIKLKFAEKYRVNDEKVEHINIAPMFKENGKVKHQLVKYMLDASGDIKKLYYAPYENSVVMRDDFTGLHYNKHYIEGAQNVRNNTVSMEYLIGADTIKYVVCTDVLGNVIEERTWCYNGGFNTKKPDMKIYDAGKNRVIGAMVVTTVVDNLTDYLAMLSSNYRGFLVEKRGMCIDQYGDIRGYIDGWQEGSPRRYYAPYDAEFNDIDRGDVLLLDYFDDEDTLYNYTKIFSIKSDSYDGIALIAENSYSSSDLAYYNTSISDRTSELVNVYGELVTMDGMMVNPYKPLIVKCKGAGDNNADVACMFHIKTSSVYAYYLDTGVAEVISYTDLDYGENIFVHCRNGVVTEVVAIR